MVAKTNKRTIAKEQLEDGLDLLLRGRYISALTVLGAAEEVLARLVEAEGGVHPMDQMWQQVNKLSRAKGQGEISKRGMYRRFNEPRNSVKHHTPGDLTSVTLFKVGAAAMMSIRATEAAAKLKLSYRLQKEHEQWLTDQGFISPPPAEPDQRSLYE